MSAGEQSQPISLTPSVLDLTKLNKYQAFGLSMVAFLNFAMILVLLILVIRIYIMERDENSGSEGMMNLAGGSIWEANNVGISRVDQTSMGGPVRVVSS